MTLQVDVPLHVDELHHIERGLKRELQAQERRLKSLRKNADGRNYLSNYETQKQTQKGIDEIGELLTKMAKFRRMAIAPLIKQLTGKDA